MHKKGFAQGTHTSISDIAVHDMLKHVYPAGHTGPDTTVKQLAAVSQVSGFVMFSLLCQYIPTFVELKRIYIWQGLVIASILVFGRLLFD